MKIKPIAGIAAGTAVLLALAGCTSAPAPAPTTEPTTAPTEAPSTEYFLDPVAEGISEAAAARITELVAEAEANGETELNLISGLANDMAPVIAAFEETFGVKVNVTELIGAPLITAIQSEVQSGNRTTDVLHNPNGQLYVDFAEAYEVVSLEVPSALAGSADQIVDPDHKFTSPFIGFFGLGVFLPRAGASGLNPTLWSDLAQPEYAGLVGMGDPKVPGPNQDAPIYLLANGGLTEADLEPLASNSIVKGTYGDAVAGLMQGEYPFLFAAPSSAVAGAAAAGAPVEFRLMDENNYVVTHKHLLMAEAPHPALGKLYLEWLNTLTAQKAVASASLTPLNLDAANPDAPWTSWEAGNVTEILPWQEIDAVRPGFIELFQQIF